MEFIIIAIITIVLTIILGIVFEYNMKELKHIADNKELDGLAQKYPSNFDICKYYLKKLNNENVKIEEDENGETSLYIAITNKIIIANISNTYTRIQTIAHECLHSVQNRKLLIFNFIFSNIYLLYFTIICILAILQLLPYKIIFLVVLILFSMVYCIVRIYLENDAMIKARYLAKEYLEETKISNIEEINKLVKGFDYINSFGIKAMNFKFFFDCMVKVLIFLIICIIR